MENYKQISKSDWLSFLRRLWNYSNLNLTKM